MSRQNRSQELRLKIGLEATALLCDAGANAYPIACRRAEEASSEYIANDWTGVANWIARRTGERHSLDAQVFH